MVEEEEGAMAWDRMGTAFVPTASIVNPINLGFLATIGNVQNAVHSWQGHENQKIIDTTIEDLR